MGMNHLLKQKEIKPLKIENIDWNVKEGVLDGRRFVNFSYTNNSEYPVVDVEIEFKQKRKIYNIKTTFYF